MKFIKIFTAAREAAIQYENAVREFSNLDISWVPSANEAAKKFSKAWMRSGIDCKDVFKK